MLSFKKILVANRGEIATRIVKAIHDLGLIAVAVYAEDDKDTLHVSLADESFSLGNGHISETYLNISKIIEIAVQSKSTAIHPGYGFLSENYLFVKACQKHDLIFIGPSAQVVQLMGDKTKARDLVKKAGIPVLDGFECTLEELQHRKDLSFPIIVKPALGGGGKGMHIIQNQVDLIEKFHSSSREAGNYFSDSRVYFEKYIEVARHIEVQILADHQGGVVHLFDRECTIQRNFQKIIEEAPSPSLDEKLRHELTSAAVQIAKVVQYTNAGTVEFLLDHSGHWYFIEMNARIQVEHTVTEKITNLDLVLLQIHIAAGNPLPFGQEHIEIKGHAIELRINAENPLNHFMPSSGDISRFDYPATCRFDTFIKGPCHLTSNYDSLIGKLVVYAVNRNTAVLEAVRALNAVHIHGVETNLAFLEAILRDHKFVNNQIYTRYCNDFVELFIRDNLELLSNVPAYIPVIAFIYLNFQRTPADHSTIWKTIGYWRTIQKVTVVSNNESFEVEFRKISSHYVYDIAGIEYLVQIRDHRAGYIEIIMNENIYKVFDSLTSEGKSCLEINRFQFILKTPNLLRTASLQKINREEIEHTLNGHIRAPLHGRVIKINVLVNAKINRGDVLLVIESMKTENHIVAPRSGTIKSIYVSEGNQVKDDMLLIEMENLNV